MKINQVPENDLMSVIVYTSIAFLLMALVLILFFYFSRKKIIQKEFEKKDLEISHQKGLLKSIILTQEAERKRIAQDLHDDISSKLNIVSLNTHLLTAEDLTDQELSQITANLINLTAKALENSRRIAHDLLPPVLEKFGLHAAVEELCHEFKTAKNIEIDFQSSITFDMIHEQLHLQIFRILQELMNNSIRHGKATHITITFSEKKNIRTCEYTDNGVGFDTSELKNKRGLGMKNIESRVEIFDGNLQFTSAIDKGVQVSFTF